MSTYYFKIQDKKKYKKGIHKVSGNLKKYYFRNQERTEKHIMVDPCTE